VSEEESNKTGYVGRRVSMKQEKIYKAMSEVGRIRREMRQKKVIGIPTLQSMRGVKEIVSGLAMPKKNDQ